ncbi:MAG: hypothetical protein ACREUU_20585, partial [Gammaproteobacteria bacterium]
LVLTMNGKPDASLGWGGPASLTADEVTMVLSAAIPLAHHSEARTAAVIGMGSGPPRTPCCSPRSWRG